MNKGAKIETRKKKLEVSDYYASLPATKAEAQGELRTLLAKVATSPHKLEKTWDRIRQLKAFLNI